jgi:hypothetical protein
MTPIIDPRSTDGPAIEAQQLTKTDPGGVGAVGGTR